MEASNLFAIVDIETTGTSQEKDKMIQFACVIVENKKIVNEISIDINPLCSIPRNITELTGISNKDVANAPYFEDVAYTIKQLLEGCVFVAHNVFFDYHFLNSEITRAGLEPMNLKCVDTVELFQILYPTSSGFRVSDMASEIGVVHENPHQALSDALVTAEGFIRMIEKLETLPMITLEKLHTLSRQLGVNNSEIFKMVIEEKRKSDDNLLKDHIVVVDELAIKKKHRDYRYCSDDIAITFESELDILRPTQKEMANDINLFIEKSNENKNLFIEAETGTGKTLGYLYPLSFIKPAEPVLISTSTIFLQNQLLNQDMGLLNELTHQNKQGVIVKSISRYLSLTSFKQTLDHPLEQKNYAICQMAVLVWLLETDTGDLDEINVNQNNSFYQQVAHEGVEEFNQESSYFEEDFLNYLIDKCRYADFIIVNHSFLFTDSQKKVTFLPEFDTVVIDEAHQLPNLIENISTNSLSFSKLSYLLNQLYDVSLKLSDNHSTININFSMIEMISQELKESSEWIEQCLSNYYSLDNKEEMMVNVGEVYQQVPILKRSVQQTKVLFGELKQLLKDVKNYPLSRLSLLEKEFIQLLETILELSSIFKLFFYDFDDNYVKWISSNKSHVELSMIDFSNLSIEQYNWYKHAKKIIYTSGSLQLDNESTYFEEKLGLTNVEKKQLPSVFDYKNQAELFLLTDVDQKSLKSTKDFAKRISKVIKKMFQTHGKTILVLFTSHQLLESVYEQLTDYYNQRDVLILGQGISGTKEKIIKKINQGNTCIVLGANSFWEGMDFNKQSIDIVIMTKLPFDPPTRPIVQARYNYLEKQGLNPFYEDALPKTGIKLRQGIGRLLRSPEDKGILVILDERLIKSSYSEILCSYLPKGLEIKPVILPILLEKSVDFLDNK